MFFNSVLKDIMFNKDLQSQYNHLSRLAKIGNWELNLKTNELWWSSEIYVMFEVDPNEFGASYEAFLAAIHPEDRDTVNKAYTQSLVDQKPYRIIHRLLLKNGDIKYVEERCETDFDEKGNPLISRGTVQDITESFLLQQKVSKSEKIVNKVLSNIPDVTFKVNLKGEITFANDQVEHLLGYSVEEIVGQSYEILLPDDIVKRHRIYFNQYLQTPQVRKMGAVEIDFQCKAKTGQLIDVVIGLGGEISENEILLIIRDNRLEIQKREKLKKEIETRDYFLRALGHEVKTPLFGMSGLIEEELKEELTLKSYKRLHGIRQNTLHLLRLHTNMINLKTLNEEEYEPLIECFRLEDMVNQELEGYEFTLIEKNIRIHLKKLNLDNEVCLKSDKELIKVVISNILKHSIDGVSDGAISISSELLNSKLELKVNYQTNTEVRKMIQLLNNGEIDLEENLFSVNSSGLNGMNIGFQLIKKAISLLKGHVSYSYADQVGLEVRVEFPVQIEEIRNHSFYGKSILIVDDIALNRNIYGLMLSSLEMQIDYAQDGKDALDKCRKTTYDLILMDIQMPEMRGDEALILIKKEKPNQPIIATTADGSVMDKRKYLNFGFDGFLGKPFTRNELLYTVASYT